MLLTFLAFCFLLARGFLFFGGYISILLCWSLVAITTFVFLPLKKRGILYRAAYRAFEIWLRRVAGIQVVYDYAVSLPSAENYIIVANHQTVWDAFAITALRLPSVTVLKKELINIPLVGWGLMTIDPIILRRKNNLQSTRRIYAEGSQKLKQGFNLVIFPQGTRVAPPEIGSFSAVAVRLAFAVNKPLLPVAHNSGELLSPAGGIKHGGTGTLRVRIGPPIYPKDFEGKKEGQREMLDNLKQQIMNMMHQTHSATTFNSAERGFKQVEVK